MKITEDDITVCNEPRLHKIEVGDKYYFPNDPYNKEPCLRLEEELNKHGFKTRIGQNIDSKVWSVAIIGLYI